MPTKFDDYVNVRMTAETTERLRALARRREVSLGALVREAVPVIGSLTLNPSLRLALARR